MLRDVFRNAHHRLAGHRVVLFGSRARGDATPRSNFDARVAGVTPLPLEDFHALEDQTKHDPEARYKAKRRLVRLLYGHGWDRRRILELFAVLDWMMRLPDVLEQKLWQDIEQIEGETRMRYVTSVERLAIERGIQQGKLEGQLELWAERVLDAPSLAAVFEGH